MFDSLSSTEVAHQLAENAEAMRVYGEQKVEAEQNMILAEKRWEDEKARIYSELGEVFKPTRLEMHIRYKTAEARRIYQDALAIYRALHTRWNTLIEINNNLKAVQRIREAESHNLQ
jgi:hypothetical protein